jgi:hypothetical protein
MARLLLPAWLRRPHPIVRYQARHWAHSRGWRLVGNLLWGGSLSFIFVPAACALLFGLQSQFTSPAEAILTLGGIFLVGLALFSSVAVLFSNLSASILGATLIARERESQSWPFLRLTTLTSLDIAGGKLMALVYTLSGPLQLITGLRLLALVAGMFTAMPAYLASGWTGQDSATFLGPFCEQFGLTFSQWQGLALFAAPAVLWATVNWLLEPFFGVLDNCVIGLTVSTFTRSRGSAIVLVFAAHFCLALRLYAPAGQPSSLLLAPLAATGSQTCALDLFPVGCTARIASPPQGRSPAPAAIHDPA